MEQSPEQNSGENEVVMDNVMENVTPMTCYFNCTRTGRLITGGATRIKKIIESSKLRDDSLHVALQESFEASGGTYEIKFHDTCVTNYNHPSQIARHIKRMACTSPITLPPTKRRSLDNKFQFKRDCIICGKECQDIDKKHKDRWRRKVEVRTIDLKKSLEKAIADRGPEDEKANDVHLRLFGAVADLHAADAVYHYDCHKEFTAPRNVACAAAKVQVKPSNKDEAFDNLLHIINTNPGRIWNSVEIHNMYEENLCHIQEPIGTTSRHVQHSRSSRSQLIGKLQNHYGNLIVIMRISGCASLVSLRDHLPNHLKLVPIGEEERFGELIDTISSEVKEKRKLDINGNKGNESYDFSRFTFQHAVEDTSPTLLSFVSSLVSSGTTTKKSLSLSQSIQGLMNNRFNQTTLGLGVKLHHVFRSRDLIDVLCSKGYTCSYDEVLRFRKSAARKTAIDDSLYHNIFQSNSIILAWFDNFDLHISTPNGQRETHCMAMEFMQNTISQGNSQPLDIVVPRISKDEMYSVKVKDLVPLPLQHFNGPKKVNPPQLDVPENVSQELLRRSQTSVRNGMEKEVSWLVEVLKNSYSPNPTPEWSGHMAKEARNNSDDFNIATRFLFGPLIDAPPAHADTVLTTLIYIETFLRKQGQIVIHISVDMQLYKIVMQIKWSSPERWSHLYVRPGGMHTLMSFIGCIGTLMSGSGLEQILEAAYNGVATMLLGKVWPKALRGLRMVVEALLEPYISEGIHTVEGIEKLFTTARDSRTGQHWVDCLILPVIIADLFLRAEKEGDWLLHLYCIQRMLPYFFVAGHWNYARYIQWYLLEMKSLLLADTTKALLEGDHVCRHKPGAWNGVFMDQFGEQTYIRYGKAKGGLVGKTLSEEQVAEWTLSHHLCNALSFMYDNMEGSALTEDEDISDNSHKEEGQKRRKLDAEDRKKIISEVKKFKNPLSFKKEDPLMNVVNGRIASEKVNVDKALTIGEKMSGEFEDQLPKGFHTPLKRNIVTLETSKKGIKIAEGRIAYDMEKLLGRILIVAERKGIPLMEVLCYELCPAPLSLFDEFGFMRKSNKSKLVQKLGCFVQDEELEEVDIEIVDGNEAFYHVLWPRRGTVRHFKEAFCKSFERNHPTYMIFDKYFRGSLKSFERKRRAGNTTYQDYQLSLDSPLPPRDTILKNENNKRELIRVFCEGGSGNPFLHLIGEDQCEFGHEEADVNVLSYLLKLQSNKQHIQVNADDTDIFVLLVHFIYKHTITTTISMKKFDGKLIDLNRSTMALGDKAKSVLPLHMLTGCDLTSYPFFKGKVGAVNLLLKSDVDLSRFCCNDVPKQKIIEIGLDFLHRLYGSGPGTDLTKLRYINYTKKGNPPKIKFLPPTNEGAVPHIRLAYAACLTYGAADEVDAPRLDSSKYGWDNSNPDFPLPVYGPTIVVPPEILNSVACNCAAGTLCSNKCSCKQAGFPCKPYCHCEGGDQCANIHTLKATEEIIQGDNDD